MTDRELSIQDEKLIIKENVETVYEKTVAPFGNSEKLMFPRSTSEDGFKSLC